MRKFFYASAAAAVAVMIMAKPAIAAQTKSFSISAQPAPTALPEFARQAGVQILVDAALTRRVRTNALFGTFPERAALEQLIAGTGLAIISWQGGVVTLGAQFKSDIHSAASQPEGQDDVSLAASNDINQTDADIVVLGIRAALASSAEKKREAGNIRDVVTAEDIGKFPDENVADSLARIPGVQITREIGEGAGFTIRGISQNRVEVNGRTTIGREEERNANIGDIPADLLGGLEVIKSPTADITEGSLGGTVSLITRRAFDFSRPTLTLNLRQGYTSNADRFQPNLNVLAATRWDTGIGEFGILLNGSYSINYLSGDRANLNGWSGACNFDLDGDRIVSTARPTDGDGDGVVDTCSDQGDFVFRPTNTAMVDTYADRTRAGLVGSLQWRPNPSLSFYFDGNFNRFREEEIKYSIFSGAVSPTTPIGNIVSLEVDENRNATLVSFANRRPQTSAQTTLINSDIYSFALGGRWQTGPLTANAEVAMSAGDTEIDALFLTTETRDANGVVAIKQSADIFSIQFHDVITGAENFRIQEYNANFWGTETTERSARVDFDYALNSGILSVLEFGARFTDQQFDRVRNNYFSQDYNQNPIRGLPVNSVTALQGLYGDSDQREFFGSFPQVSFPTSWFQFDPRVRRDQGVEPFLAAYGAPADLPPLPSESYELGERTAAGYLKVNLEGDLGAVTYRGNAGVRFVQTSIKTRTNVVDTMGRLTPRAQENDYSRWLPSANLTFDLGRGLLVRGAFARTMVRPSFNQLRPVVTYVFTTGNGTTDPYDATGGNPLLDPFEATQYDLSIEKYFGRSNLVSMALFYRDVDAFIRSRLDQNVTLPNGLLVDLTLPENGAKATVKGAEFALQYAFDFLPGVLDGLGVVGNYTYSDSKTPDRDRFGKVLELEGLSKHTYNAAVYYEKFGVSARASYNWRSRRLLTALGQAGRPNYQTPDEQLDLTLAWDVNPRFRVTLDARNLTQRLGRQYNETFNAPLRIFYEDTKYTLGVRAQF